MKCNDFFHANMSCHAMTLTFDPLTLNFCGTSGVMCSNSVENLSEIKRSAQSYWPFSTFLPSSSRGRGTFSGRFSGVRGPNFTKLGEDIGRSSMLTTFVSELRYLDAFPNSGGSKSNDFEYETKFRTSKSLHVERSSNRSRNLLKQCS